jgi:Tol biopolymer transport system component
MDESQAEGSRASPNGDSRDDRLDSWKQIAEYLGRAVTTAQRWEQEEGLPVHRHPHAKKQSIFAFKRELDAWRIARAQSPSVRLETDSGPAGSPIAPVGDPPVDRRWRFGLAAAVLAVAVLGAVWTVGRSRSNDSGGADISIAPRPLANDQAIEGHPSLSPDGDEVVYYWERQAVTALYIKPVAGGQARRLSIGDLKTEGFPKWSPRGDLIAFLSRTGENARAVYVVPPAGGTPRLLAPASGIGLCWAPDGKSIGFVARTADGDPLSIFVFSLETGQRRRLTLPPRGSFGDTHCAFSPDGGRLAVVRYPTISQSDLYISNIQHGDGGQIRQVTYDFEGIAGLTWTPDGKAIVFGSQSGLWKVDPSSDRPQQPTLVLAGAGQLAYPAFSRASATRPARLAYESHIRDVNLWRWHHRADANDAITKWEDASTQWEDYPAFSPDGRRVAFASNRTGSNEIWVAHADGSDSRQVTFHRGPLVISPRWSPDGKRLVYSSQVRGNRDIYVMAAEGAQSVRLTWEASQEENPSWSRDGRWIYFRSDRTGVGQIWKVSPDGGQAVSVTPGEGSEGFESPDGRVLYFVRSRDVPGVWSVPIEGGQEKLVIPDVREAYWGVADSGIAFIAFPSRLSPEGPTLRFFDFASQKITVLASLPTEAIALSPGFAVSRNGQSVLWVQRDRSERDLMLIDPWRP